MAAAGVAGVRTGVAAGAQTAAEADEPEVAEVVEPRRCTWQAAACSGCTEAAKDCRPWAEPREPAAAGTTAGVGAVGSCAVAVGHTAVAGEASAEVACLSSRHSPLRPPRLLRQPSCGCRPESGP